MTSQAKPTQINTPRPPEEGQPPVTRAPVALVTGASRGIGAEVARRLAQEGYRVVVSYAGRQALAEQVVGDVVAAGGQAWAWAADVADEGAVAGLFKEILEREGGLEAVVHSAGIMPYAPIAPESLADFDRVIATNLRGTFLVLAQAARYLGPGGRIVALSSSVIAKSFPSYGPYIASKAGVEGLIRVLANELRGRNITVNGVAPGPVGTALFLQGKSEAQIAQLAKVPPLERLGRPEDIAGVVAFLLGKDGGWINGQVLRANGGFA